jgi:Integrase core domain/leucine-zipper of insertion element IS481
MAHRNARLTEFGRLLLVQRITELGWPPAQAAESLGCREPPPTSGLPATAPKGRPAWPTAARGRITAPLPCPLPRSGGCWRPAGAVARVPTGSATTSACPARPSMGAAPPRDEPAGPPDRTSGVAIRYQRERPGELVHLDVKKLGRIPDGGGHKLHGRADAKRGRGIGYDYVHSAIDDRSRVAVSQLLADETGETSARFLVEAAGCFADHGVRIERVLTDNAKAYTDSVLFTETAAELSIRLKRTRPYRPQTKGKVERFNAHPAR